VLERHSGCTTHFTPIRITIDKPGNVKHIHLIGAFPDQAKAISDAVKQWRFKPLLVEGKPIEVATGIMFGRAPQTPAERAGRAGVH
jgi:hypothetical protein